jgi:uracil phosphoribosyltransferase
MLSVDITTGSKDFVAYSKRAMRLVVEDALAEFPASVLPIATPCSPNFAGLVRIPPESICAVSIIRSGDALVEAVREVEPGVTVGKILIQRDESHPDKIAKLYYSKLPPNIANMHVLLCDPMLATGGSAAKAVATLCQNGVDPATIIFANMICAPEGLRAMATLYPMVKIVTACVDDALNEEMFIVPGLGDYGDRFFNT